MSKNAAYEEVRHLADDNVEEKILDILLPRSDCIIRPGGWRWRRDVETRRYDRTPWKSFANNSDAGDLDDRLVEIDTKIAGNCDHRFCWRPGLEEMGVKSKGLFGNLFPRKQSGER
jgi:ATP-dependent protease HslVU (ClpYQ) ATPase subunit